ncbi:MAG: PadR family transcriptional regulator [Lachnospiraceae bacterium]|nr:PadR family transcriptional regulator [Lachnospiraceae bacterium]
MAANDGLRRINHIEMIALAILSENDYYGYQITQLIEAYSNGIIKLTEGSLYPVLYRLEDQGLISSERRQVGKRMTRVYYHIEPSGAARLSNLLAEYQTFHSGLQSILDHASKEETV